MVRASSWSRRRLLTFLSAFLLSVPVVAFAADSAERAVDTDVFIRFAPVRDGERYVYDLHVTSEFHDVNVRVPAFTEVVFERVTEYQAIDGSVHDVLKVQSSQTGRPWLSGDVSAGRFRVDIQDHRRIDDGAFVERIKEDLNTYWLEGDGDIIRRESRIMERTMRVAEHERLFDAAFSPPGLWVNGNALEQLVARMAAPGAGRVTGVGQWNNLTVYDIYQSGATGTMSGGQLTVLCITPVVRYDYIRSHLIAEGETPTTKWNRHEQVWLDNDLALPVMTACTTTHDWNDERIEKVFVALELVHHEKGGDEIVIPKRDRDVIPTAPRLSPEATSFAAAPNGGALLDVPLERALRDLRQSGDDALETGVDGDSLWLVAARFLPTGHYYAWNTETPVGDLPVPLIVPDPANPPSGPEDLVAQPEWQRTKLLWELSVANLNGDLWRLDLEYNATEGGAFQLEDVQVKSKVPNWRDPVGPQVVDVPLVGLDAMIDQFLTDGGLDVTDWLHDMTASMTLENEPRRLANGTTAFASTITFRGRAADDEASLSRSYDLRNGGLLGAREATSRDSDAAEVPSQPNMPRAAVSTPAPLSTFPAAATLSVLALTIGFVALYVGGTIPRRARSPGARQEALE